MDFTSHNDPTTTHPQKHHPKPSSSELLSSAKLVAEAAKSTLNHESNKVDKAKVAGAAADLLDAVESYGKLEEKSFGRYLDKAEDYLHQYHSSHSTTTTTTKTTHSGDSATHTTTTATATATHESSHLGGEEHSGSAYGDYMKMAEGLFKKF